MIVVQAAGLALRELLVLLGAPERDELRPPQLDELAVGKAGPLQELRDPHDDLLPGRSNRADGVVRESVQLWQQQAVVRWRSDDVAREEQIVLFRRDVEVLARDLDPDGVPPEMALELDRLLRRAQDELGDVLPESPHGSVAAGPKLAQVGPRDV